MEARAGESRGRNFGTDFGPERPQKKKNPALTRREYEDRRKKHTAITVGRSMSMSMEYEYEYGV